MKRALNFSRAAWLQYAIATIIALAFVGYQLSQTAARWGLDAMHPRIQVMREQITSALLEHPTALAEVAFHLAAVLLTHITLCVGSVFIYRQAFASYRHELRDRLLPATGFLFTSTLTATLWNRLLYPYSTALRDTELLLIQPTTSLLLWGTTGIVALVAFAALFNIIRKTPTRAAAAVLSISLIALWGRGEAALSLRNKTSNSAPDLIILGVDSLRPDLLNAYGFRGQQFMPNIEAALEKSVIFEDAVTPLARTFVSYMSLLTGSDPTSHGARFNLYPRAFIKRDATLGNILRDQNYYSIFSIDESRFANFDRSFGFDEVVSPPPGALDFLLGNAFDTVGTNIFMGLPHLEKLFPYSRANRAAYNVYQPSSSVQHLLRAIEHTPQTQPIFLVSHFCLPHWPYLPADILRPDSSVFSISQAGFEGVPEHYPRALTEVDDQLQTVMNALRKAGRLDNAVLVIMSDHGEGFATGQDTRVDLAPFAERTRPAPPFGHGSAALSRAQNHVVLGIQRYVDGRPAWAPRVMKGPASLIDVAPTLAEAVGAPMDSFNGRSMLAALDSNQHALGEQFRFVENGIRSTGVEKPVIDEGAVALEMAYLYEIQPDLRFEIRPSLAQQKIGEKQRGVLWGELGLAATPDTTGSGPGCWVLVNYQDSSSSCVEYPSDRTAVRRMQEAACRHYSGDPGFIDSWCVDAELAHRQHELE